MEVRTHTEYSCFDKYAWKNRTYPTLCSNQRESIQLSTSKSLVQWTLPLISCKSACRNAGQFTATLRAPSTDKRTHMPLRLYHVRKLNGERITAKTTNVVCKTPRNPPHTYKELVGNWICFLEDFTSFVYFDVYLLSIIAGFSVLAGGIYMQNRNFTIDGHASFVGNSAPIGGKQVIQQHIPRVIAVLGLT